MAIGEARPGYELWRPNRAKPGSQTARFVIALLLVVSAVLMVIVLAGGWAVLMGGSVMGIITLVFVFVDLLLAFMIARWSRGALSLTVALSVLLMIYCLVGANSWFARDKPGFEETGLPADLIGLLVLILVPVQIALVVAAAIGVRQEWHVEEERPIGSGDGNSAAGPSDPAPIAA